MIKLMYSTVTHPQFQNAFKNLASQRHPVKVTHDLKILGNRLDQAIKEADDVRLEMLSKYCVMEDGKFVPQKTEEGKEIAGSITPIEETKKEFEQKFMEYLTTEVEVKGYKFCLDDISGAKLSIEELSLLAPIIEEDED